MCWEVGGVLSAGMWTEGYARENEEKTVVDDRTGDVGVSSESLNAMLAVP